MKTLKFYVVLRKSTGQSQNRCVLKRLNGSVTHEMGVARFSHGTTKQTFEAYFKQRFCDRLLVRGTVPN